MTPMLGGSNRVKSCTLQITGTKASDNTTVVTEGIFAPATIPTQTKYAFVQFPSTFTGLKQVEIELIQTSIPVDTIAILDNISYKAYYKHC